MIAKFKFFGILGQQGISHSLEYIKTKAFIYQSEFTSHNKPMFNFRDPIRNIRKLKQSLNFMFLYFKCTSA